MSHLALEVHQLFEEFEEEQREESMMQLALYRERKYAASRARTQELKKPCNADKFARTRESKAAYVERMKATDVAYYEKRRISARKVSASLSAARQAERRLKWSRKALPIPGFRGFENPEPAPVTEQIAEKLVRIRKRQAEHMRDKRHPAVDTATPLLDYAKAKGAA